MAKTVAVATIINAATTVTAGTPTRGTLDVRGLDGGNITVKVANGGTPPTVEAKIRILGAHTTGTTPSAAAAGTDWKTLYEVGCGTVASAVTETVFEFGPGYAHLEVEIGGNTVQNVTGEAFATTIVYP